MNDEPLKRENHKKVSQDEWEKLVSNRIASKAFKTVFAIVIPIIGILSYIGYDFVKEAKLKITNSENKLNKTLSNIEVLEKKMIRKLDTLDFLISSQASDIMHLEELPDKYGDLYQKYIEQIFDSYIANTDKLFDDVTDIKVLKIDYDKKLKEVAQNIKEFEKLEINIKSFRVNTLEQIKSKVDSINSQNLQFKNSFDSEILVLTQKTPIQVSRISKTRILYEDDNKISQIKRLKVFDLKTNKQLLNIGPIFKEKIEYFRDEMGKEFSIQLLFIESKNLWQKDYAIILVKKESNLR